MLCPHSMNKMLLVNEFVSDKLLSISLNAYISFLKTFFRLSKGTILL